MPRTRNQTAGRRGACAPAVTPLPAARRAPLTLNAFWKLLDAACMLVSELYMPLEPMSPLLLGSSPWPAASKAHARSTAARSGRAAAPRRGIVPVCVMWHGVVRYDTGAVHLQAVCL